MSLEGKELGRYHLHRLIGSGGMGEVYLAEDTQVRRQIAIKVIKLEAAQSNNEAADSLRLFLREATAIARLDHPNILPLYDHGEKVIDAVRYAYLITPYRADGSLVNWLQKQFSTQKMQHLTLKQVTHIVQQAAGALQYAHNHQVIHQDVKPANFLVRSEADGGVFPDLQLADFGIAHLTSATSKVSQNVRGTPLYMAPEQWSGLSTFASDQYSLAVMIYELLTGTVPFQGSPYNMMYAHLHDIPRSPRELNPQLPPAVDTVLLRALAKKPEERFESVAAFARAFQLLFQDSDERTTYRAPSFAPVTPIPGQLPTGDIRATLSISTDEARSGTLRSLTVTGGRVVNIQIPPGVQNGHMITLAGMGEASGPGGGAGNLYLSLSVVQTEKQVFSSEDATATLLREYTLTRTTPDTPVQPLISGGIVSPVTPIPTVFSPPISGLHSRRTEENSPPTGTVPAQPLRPLEVPASNRRRSPVITVIALVMVLLLLGGGFGVYYALSRAQNSLQTASSTHTASTVQTNSSPTTSANVSTPGSTPTAQATSGNTTGNDSPGGTWYQQDSGTEHYLSTVTWAGTQFLAAGDNGTVLTSPDGDHWTLRNTQHPSAFLLSAGCADALCVVVGNQGTILTSQDGGVTWNDYSLAPPAPDLRAIIWSGKLFAVVGTGGTILTSSDGLNWQKVSGLPGNVPDLSGVRWTGKLFIAVGDHGTILTSPDGYSWTSQHSPTTMNLKAAKPSGGSSPTVYVIVGEHGTILTSSDAANWTLQTVPSDSATVDLTGVTWSKSFFVVSGAQGAILTSPDGKNWTRQQSGTNQDFECIATSGGKFVAVGIGGLIATSA